ncbi:MAG: hypothetical protein AAF488_13210, partial [Planctomycetota bacterium]
MDQSPTPVAETVSLERDPSNYTHWRVEFDGPIARIHMQVEQHKGLRDGYELKLNSYDLGVDIELADIVRRMRFEHPEVNCLVVTSGHAQAFCSGANACECARVRARARLCNWSQSSHPSPYERRVAHP